MKMTGIVVPRISQHLACPLYGNQVFKGIQCITVVTEDTTAADTTLHTITSIRRTNNTYWINMAYMMVDISLIPC